VTSEWLGLEDPERAPCDELRLQIQAMSQVTPEEKSVARAVLEGRLLKHAAHRFPPPRGNT
jgi:hypothetical protein